ncbi:MAG: hypothetical protein R2705_21275 [Ilumatobacteraceae bacterium]
MVVRIISGSHDRTVRVWDPDHPDHPQVLTGHTDWVRAVAIMTGADGRPRIISGSHDRTVRVCGRTTRPHPKVLTGHTNSVWAVGVMTGADGRPASSPAATTPQCGCGTRTTPTRTPKSSPATPAPCRRWE